jgi:hypothetical protein
MKLPQWMRTAAPTRRRETDNPHQPYNPSTPATRLNGANRIRSDTAIHLQHLCINIIRSTVHISTKTGDP